MHYQEKKKRTLCAAVALLSSLFFRLAFRFEMKCGQVRHIALPDIEGAFRPCVCMCVATTGRGYLLLSISFHPRFSSASHTISSPYTRPSILTFSFLSLSLSPRLFLLFSETSPRFRLPFRPRVLLEMFFFFSFFFFLLLSLSLSCLHMVFILLGHSLFSLSGHLVTSQLSSSGR